jgi:hypothetical protein
VARATRKRTEGEVTPWSAEGQSEDIERVNEFLRDIADRRVTVETAFEWREDDSPKIALPSKPEKMTYAEGAQLLAKKADAEEEMYEFGENFKCRPMDGAFAFNMVLKDIYGMTAIGKAIRGWGGTQLPELRTVHIGLKESMQVPWGLLVWPPWNAEFYLTEWMDKDYGYAFRIQGAAKKKYEGEIQGLFMLVHRYLEEHSIYRGKALVGTGIPSGQGYSEPEFLDAYAINREEIVYNTDVEQSLVHGLWGRITHRKVLADSKRKRPRKFNPKVLVHGENGTGKTVAGLISAQHCLENDMTFIQAAPDEDLAMVMRFAEHVGTPALVMVEDAEKLIDEEPKKLDKLLEIFDGMRTKGREVGLLLTTNHPEELPPALMRAKRINRAIYISDLDAEALRRLIDIHISEDQREDLDYDALAEAFEGFKPSWIVQVLEDADDGSVIRTGEIGLPLATEDFVQEALVMRQLHEMHQRSLTRPKKPEIETALYDLLSRVLREHRVDLDAGEILVRS